jgi:Flp pilus assembly protein TadD
VTAVKQNAQPADGAAGIGWAPRLAQESRLRQLEVLRAGARGGAETIATEIERAALLGALDRRQDAQQAFIDILHRWPTNFSALNEFGTLLASQGAIDAACRVYAEAILHHPDNPMGHVNLANLLLRANKHEQARVHYEAALRTDPDHAQAHQGLGAVLADDGDRDGAREHFRKGFAGHAISSLPYRGSEPPVMLLQLVSSGGGNIPTAPFLDDRIFLTSVVVADYLDPKDALPPHQLIFNAIGDADLCESALSAAISVIARSSAPVVNDPRAVMRSGRIGNAQRLAALPGVVTPKTLSVARDILAGPDGAAWIADHQFTFPLLLRSPGYHTGRNFILVEKGADLAAAAAGLPMHLAISRNWKVHYFTSDMADQPDHRAEELAFLGDMTAVLGDKAMAALTAIRDALGLDYAGVDFGLGSDGDVLLFEANATMVIAAPDPDPRWEYRRTAITGIIDAVVEMIRARARAGSAKGANPAG